MCHSEGSTPTFYINSVGELAALGLSVSVCMQ